MILHIYADASYLSEPEAHRISGGCYFLGPKSKKSIRAMHPENGTVHV